MYHWKISNRFTCETSNNTHEYESSKILCVNVHESECVKHL
jgi:hypothetical protein